MFEHRSEPMLSRREFVQRVGTFALFALLLIGISLCIGVLGYRLLEGMPWVDALLNSAMILGGMGPVSELYTVSGKVFASLYALFSGIIFLVAVGVLLAPIIHRLLHKFHLQNNK